MTKPRVPKKNVDLENSGEPSPPRLPNDRDEAVGSTGGVPNEQVRQGHRDLQRGLQDTSRASEADQAYDKLKTKP
jgi:hypothetical protein